MNRLKQFNDTEPRPLQTQLDDLLSTLTEITRGHAQTIPGGIFTLEEDQQQSFLNTLNPYLAFEFTQHPELKDLPIRTTGIGMMYLSDHEGNILGAETISVGDIVTGKLVDVCALPTPTVECLAASDETEIPVIDQTLSPIIILNGATFINGDNPSYAHNLSNYQVSLPLAHYLAIRIDN